MGLLLKIDSFRQYFSKSVKLTLLVARGHDKRA
jgi:hypothetical protein